MIFQLVQDFGTLLDVLPARHSSRCVLALLDEAIRRDVHFLARRPMTLFQSMWNLGWWHEDVRARIEHWRVRKEQVTPDFPWLRSLRPPADPLGSGLRWVFAGLIGRSEIRKVVFSPDGDCLGAMGFHQAAHCDLRTGRVEHMFDSEAGLVDIFFRENGGFAAVERVLDTAGRQVGTRTWNVTDRSEFVGRPAPLAEIGTRTSVLPYTAVERDGQVEVLDRADGRLLYRFPGDEFFRPNLKFTVDGRYLIQADSHLTIWDLHDGHARARVRASESARQIQQFLDDFILSPDGRLIVGWGRDGTVRVWAFAEMTVQPPPRQEAPDDVVALRFDGPTWLRVRGHVGPRELDDPWPVWDARTVSPINFPDVAAILPGPLAKGTEPSFAVDMRRFAAVLNDGRIVLGDSETRSISGLPAPEAPVARLVFSPDGRWLAGLARDAYSAVIWDLNTLQLSAVIEHNFGEHLFGYGPMELQFAVNRVITSRHVYLEPGDREVWRSEQTFELPSGQFLAHGQPQLRRKRIRRPDGGYALDVFGLATSDEFIALEGEGPWSPRFDGLEVEMLNSGTGVAVGWFPVAPQGSADLVSAIAPDGQTIALAVGNRVHLLVIEGKAG